MPVPALVVLQYPLLLIYQIDLVFQLQIVADRLTEQLHLMVVFVIRLYVVHIRIVLGEHVHLPVPKPE